MKKKKNAFTLIELLAIIVILAIIAVITVPIILNIIENARKGAAIDSAYGYKDSINKYYLAKLSENQNYNDLDGEYTINSDGYLVENGTVKHQIQVSGQKPSGGTMTIQNKIITTACVQIGEYKVPILNGTVGQAEKGECPEPLSIGSIVNYSTTLNGIELNNWKIFYIDGDYTYIILDDYLPRAAISNSLRTNYNLADGNGSTYTIRSKTNRTDLKNAMTTTSNWVDLINNGFMNETALSIEVKNNANVWAMGAPDINLWVNSWNSERNGFITSMTLSGDNTNGYYINGERIVHLQDLDRSKANYSLYFPNIGDRTYSYWLSSLEPESSQGVYMASTLMGYLGTQNYSVWNSAFRPVVCLPTSVVNQ